MKNSVPTNQEVRCDVSLLSDFFLNLLTKPMPSAIVPNSPPPVGIGTIPTLPGDNTSGIYAPPPPSSFDAGISSTPLSPPDTQLPQASARGQNTMSGSQLAGKAFAAAQQPVGFAANRWLLNNVLKPSINFHSNLTGIGSHSETKGLSGTFDYLLHGDRDYKIKQAEKENVANLEAELNKYLYDEEARQRAGIPSSTLLGGSAVSSVPQSSGSSNKDDILLRVMMMMLMRSFM